MVAFLLLNTILKENMKNQNLSLLDANQMTSRTFDESHDAQRVLVVGSDIAESIKDALKDIKIEANSTPMSLPVQQIDPLVIKIPYQTVIKETEIVTVNIPTIVTEYKTIEIEKPIVVTEYKTIEKQIVVKEYQEFPKSLIYMFAAQIFISLLALILHK